MPFIAVEASPEFRLPGLCFAGLASPSRGAVDSAVWRVTIDPHTGGAVHQLTREETIVAIKGSALARLGDEAFALVVGSALIVPPGVDFALSNPHDAPFEAIAVLPVGGQARVAGGTPFTPPWAE